MNLHKVRLHGVQLLGIKLSKYLFWFEERPVQAQFITSYGWCKIPPLFTAPCCSRLKGCEQISFIFKHTKGAHTLKPKPIAM